MSIFGRVSSRGRRAKYSVDMTFTLLNLGLTFWLSNHDASHVASPSLGSHPTAELDLVNLWPMVGSTDPPTFATTTLSWSTVTETIMPLTLSTTAYNQLSTDGAIMTETTAASTVSPTASSPTPHILRADEHVNNPPARAHPDQLPNPYHVSPFVNFRRPDARYGPAPDPMSAGGMRNNPSHGPFDLTMYPQPALAGHSSHRHTDHSVTSDYLLSDNVQPHVRNGIHRDRDTPRYTGERRRQRLEYALQQHEYNYENPAPGEPYANGGPSHGLPVYPQLEAAHDRHAPGYSMPPYPNVYQQANYIFQQPPTITPNSQFVLSQQPTYVAQPLLQLPNPSVGTQGSNVGLYWNQPHQVINPAQHMSGQAQLQPMPPASSITTLSVRHIRDRMRQQTDVVYPHVWTHKDILYKNGLLHPNVVGKYICEVSATSSEMQDAALEAFHAESTFQLHFLPGDRSDLHPGLTWLKSMPRSALKHITNIDLELDWYTGIQSQRHRELISMVKLLGHSQNLQRLDLHIDMDTLKERLRPEFCKQALVKLLAQFHDIPNVEIETKYRAMPEQAAYLHKRMTSKSRPDDSFPRREPQLVDSLPETTQALDWKFEDYEEWAVVLGFDMTTYSRMSGGAAQHGIVAGAMQYNTEQKQRLRHMELDEQEEREAEEDRLLQMKFEAQEKDDP